DLREHFRAEILGDGRGQRAAFLHLEPGQTLRAEILHYEVRQLVDRLARVTRGGALSVDAAHASAGLNRGAEYAELALPGQVGQIDQFHAKSQVGRVVAEPLHRFVVSHPRQRQLNRFAQRFLGDAGDQAVDQRDDVFAFDERHLQVELRELWLPV